VWPGGHLLILAILAIAIIMKPVDRLTWSRSGPRLAILAIKDDRTGLNIRRGWDGIPP
jgi:hypothetical protein